MFLRLTSGISEHASHGDLLVLLLLTFFNAYLLAISAYLSEKQGLELRELALRSPQPLNLPSQDHNIHSTSMNGRGGTPRQPCNTMVLIILRLHLIW
jgi:hypothetical protein